MIESMDLRGQLTLLLADSAGNVVFRREYKNRIVTGGRTLVAQLFSGKFEGAPPGPVTHMAVGAGSDAPKDGDTALQAQRGARKAISNATSTVIQARPDGSAGPAPQPVPLVERVRVTLEAVFDFGEVNDPAKPLREAGLFTAADGGVMYNRVVFEPVTKTEAFKLTLLWDVVF